MSRSVQEIDTSALELLTELQQARDVLSRRLQQLQEEEGNVSPVVYQRVRTDYQNRLRANDDEAGPLLRDAAESYRQLVALLKRLEAEAADLRFDLEELEVRHRIGELNEKTVSERRQGLEGREAEIQRQLGEVAELRQRFLSAVDAEEDLLRLLRPEESEPEELEEAPSAVELAAEEPSVQDPSSQQAPAARPPSGKAAMAMSPTATDPDGADDEPRVRPPTLKLPATGPEDDTDSKASPRPGATAIDGEPNLSETDSGRTRMVAQPLVSPLAATSMMPLASLIREDEGGESANGTGVFPVEPFTAIGRTADNQIQVDEVSVSRYHAEIELRQQGYHVRDLDSANGTYVNGRRVAERELTHDDVLRFGTVRFRFRLAGA